MRMDIIRSVFYLAFAVTAACGGSDVVTIVPFTVDNVAGDYIAITPSGAGSKHGVLTSTAAGVTTDELANGASIQLILNKDATTAGHLSVPDQSLEADLAGTWTLSGNTVALHQTADTFIRDLTLTVANGQLDGERNVSGVTVHVTLVRR